MEPMGQRSVTESDFDDYADYYRMQLRDGMEFQDYVTRKLYQAGIVVVTYASKRFQNLFGENILGMEIKLDKKFRKTGNLYIETHEKANPKNLDYVPSGINRDDNSWLYAIGDEERLFVFSPKYLHMIKSKYREITKPTSIGFLIPLADAEKYALRIFEWEEW